jgi:probable biosynthetic protein (TIGR04098 family)
MKTTKIKLGMPHLNYNGLDETWLFKYLGNIHWDLLRSEVDMYSEDERFYASFFHIQLKFKSSQEAFKENDVLTIKSKLFRYDARVYRSEHTFGGSTMVMDTIFVKKNQTGLVKYIPKHVNPKYGTVEDIGLAEYQQQKKRIFADTSCVNGNRLIFPPANVFNGVKILYCANYLFLVSLSEYVQHQKLFNPIKAIDINYYGNMDVADSLYGRTKLSEDEQSTQTYLTVNNLPISYCEIQR